MIIEMIIVEEEETKEMSEIIEAIDFKEAAIETTKTTEITIETVLDKNMEITIKIQPPTPTIKKEDITKIKMARGEIETITTKAEITKITLIEYYY